jgi:RNA polymerase sigma-70 factor (ECF subfamily)
MDLLGPIHDRAQVTARNLSRSDAEGDDLFQDAVLRALTRLPSLRDERAFPAWFYRILVSLHRNRRRRGFWRRLLPMDAIADTGAEPIGDDGAAWEDRRARSKRLRDALATLPAVQREAVVLFEIDGYTLDEIAAFQGASLSAVKSRLVRGRDRLRLFYRALDACRAQAQVDSNTESEVGADAATIDRAFAHTRNAS